MPGVDRLNRLSKFKFNSRLEESRRRRNEVTIELRKMKRDEQLLKRRNMDLEEFYYTSPEKNDTSMNINDIISNMNSSDIEVALKATQDCRKMLSRQTNPPIDTMIEKGIVPKCVKYLYVDDCAPLQFEAAWVLTNIASGTKAQTKVVIDNDGVPALIKLLHSDHAHVLEQAVWALGNIAGDGPEARKIIFSYDPMPVLVKLCNADASLSLIKNIVWTISNLCRCKDSDKINKVKPALQLLRDLLTCNDKEIISDACWAWSYLTDGSNEKIQMCIDAKIVPHLIKMLECDDYSILTPTIRALGNIVTGTDVQTDTVINHGVTKYLEKLLKHEKRNLVKESSWLISNLCAGNSNQIEEVCNAGLLIPLINVLEFGDPKSKKEAAFAIMNITTGGTSMQIKRLVEEGVLIPLCNLLENSDSQLLNIIIDTLINILKTAQKAGELNVVILMIEECGGLDKIEALQNHHNSIIYQKVVTMIDVYLGAEESDQENNSTTTYDNHNENRQLGFHVNENTPANGFQF